MRESYLCVPNEDNSFYDLRLTHALSPELIFVFGSNLAGRHGAGAAKHAHLHYGARYGIGQGLIEDKSYAIPTKDAKLKVLSLEEIKKHVEVFKSFTETSKLFFYVTPIGTGLAGYSHEQIAPMFKGVKNCWLPLQWRKYIYSREEIIERLNRKDNKCQTLSMPRDLSS